MQGSHFLVGILLFQIRKSDFHVRILLFLIGKCLPTFAPSSRAELVGYEDRKRRPGSWAKLALTSGRLCP